MKVLPEAGKKDKAKVMITRNQGKNQYQQYKQGRENGKRMARRKQIVKMYKYAAKNQKLNLLNKLMKMKMLYRPEKNNCALVNVFHHLIIFGDQCLVHGAFNHENVIFTSRKRFTYHCIYIQRDCPETGKLKRNRWKEDPIRKFGIKRVTDERIKSKRRNYRI